MQYHFTSRDLQSMADGTPRSRGNSHSLHVTRFTTHKRHSEMLFFETCLWEFLFCVKIWKCYL